MPGVTPAPAPAKTMPPLLASVDCTEQVHLVVGSNALAGARCSRSLEVGATVKLIAPESSALPYGVQKRVDDGEVEWIRREFCAEDLTTLGREEVDHVVDLVFVTLPPACAQGAYISKLCRRLRIPVNVTDAPALCSFSLLSTHSDGPLQIGVTTSGNGCKLATRIKRELVSSLPAGIGGTCEKLGSLRRRLRDEEGAMSWGDDEDSTDQKSTFNALVKPEDADAAKTRRVRWLSQICEYWPLDKLCALTEEDIDAVLQDYTAGNADGHHQLRSQSEAEAGSEGDHAPDFLPTPLQKHGKIHLIGTGPGHPDLLTTAALKAITSAELVLADKLVPAPVLSLIPRRAELHIAKKFPGNADAAQAEFLSLGLSGLQRGLNVVRLKQGDPYIYGRGGEEHAFFSEHGYAPVVLPGITSALSAPLFAGIPPTHRGVADEILICTGTGRKGAAPEPPEYRQSRTVVFLMALHRLESLIQSLVGVAGSVAEGRKRYPKETPCAVIERASCSDQRVVRSTLEYVAAAVEEVGSRPPGLLVVGRACEVLHMPGKERWTVQEGFSGF